MKDELRAMVDSMRRALRVEWQTIDDPFRDVAKCADELESLLARAEEPPCTRCGQKINGPAPRGICGDCTAEDPEQAARERLGRWLAAKARRTWYDYAPDPQSFRCRDQWTVKVAEEGTDIGIADRATLAEAINAALDLAEGKEPTR